MGHSVLIQDLDETKTKEKYYFRFKNYEVESKIDI